MNKKAELFYRYLSATSSSPNGGLKSIAYFDIGKVKNTYKIIIPNTQFSYSDILSTMLGDQFIQKLIRRKVNFKFKPTLEAVLNALMFLQILWDSFTISKNGKIDNHFSDPYTNLVIRNNNYKNQSWEINECEKTYDSCHFDKVDFSNKLVSDDFIFCTFENCNFKNTIISLEGVQARLTILHCTFKNCINIPQSFNFQYGLKNCKFIYE